MSKNILVIGGAGYIGSHAAKLLYNRGYHPIVLDDLSRGHRELVKWGDFIQGDLGAEKVLTDVFSQYSIDTVMHFAAYAYVGESVKKPNIYYENNTMKPIQLLNSMVKAGVKKLIFSSTCATYGEILPGKIPIEENHPQQPINPYGWSKLMLERIIQDYSVYGIKSLMFRYFNAAGCDPESETGEWHEPETHLIPLIIKSALGTGKELTIFGDDYEIPEIKNHDGTAVRDYIHVNDLVDAHIKGIDYLDTLDKSEAFNLGNGMGFSVMEMIRAAEKVMGRKVPFSIGERRKGDPPILVGSSKKAKEILNWEPKYTDIGDIIETAYLWEKNFK